MKAFSQAMKLAKLRPVIDFPNLAAVTKQWYLGLGHWDSRETPSFHLYEKIQSRLALWLGVVILLVQNPVAEVGTLPHASDPTTDLAFIEIEPYPSYSSSAGPMDQGLFWRLAAQIPFPAGSVAGHELFGVYKSTFIDHTISYQGQKLNEGLLQRYWLSGGVMVVKKPTHSGVFLVGVGLNTDFADIGGKDWNTEWMYSHSFNAGAAFTWGIGLDVQQYFGQWVPYPLVFIDWKLSDKTRFRWDADYVEFKRFLNSRLCLTGGVRFNLEFFALAKDASYEYQSAGLETGLQFYLGANFYARLKYKELVWGKETIQLPHAARRYETDLEGGRSLRLNFVYGI